MPRKRRELKFAVRAEWKNDSYCILGDLGLEVILTFGDLTDYIPLTSSEDSDLKKLKLLGFMGSFHRGRCPNISYVRPKFPKNRILK